jgi:ABC-2 type transport system ATP-binding protein
MGALRHLGAAETKRRAAALLERFDLVDAANTMTKNYSGGMLRRLDLAMTLMGDPSIIFLDEPTTGLDPRSRRAVWDNVRELVAGGVTVLLTTQYLEEADQLADRVAVLDRGRIVASGTPAELKRLVAGGYIRLRLHTGEDFDTATVTFADAVADRESRTLRVPSDGGLRSLRGVLDRLDAAGLDVEALEVHTPDLDDVFLALTESETRRVRRAEPEVAR